MLSKVANRIYWMGRHLERAEDTARMINAYYHVELDLPVGTELGWELFLQLTASRELFDGRYNRADERNIIRFMQADLNNPGSILSAISAARENVRTTRDVLPSAAWESVNELYLLAKGEAEKSVARRRRYAFLTQVIERCQQLSGLLESNMSRDQAYNFHTIGRHLERADMTTRILDVGAGALLLRQDSPLPFDSILWMNILKSLGALAMYRRQMGPRVKAARVLEYVLFDKLFSRAFAYCLEEVNHALALLPRHEPVCEQVVQLSGKLNISGKKLLARDQLHQYLDRLQHGLIDIDRRINETWFMPEKTA